MLSWDGIRSYLEILVFYLGILRIPVYYRRIHVLCLGIHQYYLGILVFYLRIPVYYRQIHVLHLGIYRGLPDYYYLSMNIDQPSTDF